MLLMDDNEYLWVRAQGESLDLRPEVQTTNTGWDRMRPGQEQIKLKIQNFVLELFKIEKIEWAFP